VFHPTSPTNVVLPNALTTCAERLLITRQDLARDHSRIGDYHKNKELCHDLGQLCAYGDFDANTTRNY
jgi:hypothetical protein